MVEVQIGFAIKSICLVSEVKNDLEWGEGGALVISVLKVNFLTVQ